MINYVKKYRYEFIRRNLGHMTYEEMAQKLNVSLITIKKDSTKVKQRNDPELRALSLPKIGAEIIGQILSTIRYEAECWTTDTDYINIDGVWYSAKRILYYHYKGCPIDFERARIFRMCNNPKCVCPDHMLAKLCSVCYE